MKDHAQRFKIHEAEYHYTYICTNETALKLRDKLLAQKEVWQDPSGMRMGLDTETDRLPAYKDHQPERGPKSGLDPHLSRIRLVQIYDLKGRTWILDLFHVDIKIVVSILKSHKWVAHYAVFDQAHIRKLSPEIDCLDIECSMVAGFLIDRAEHSPYEPDEDDEEEVEEDDLRVKTRGFGLHALATKYLKFSLRKEFQTSNWGEPELSNEQLAYAAIDAVVCSRLHSMFVPIIAKYGMERIYKLSNLMVPVIAEMQGTGLPIDHTVHRRLINEWEAKRDRAEVETNKFFPGVNLNSPKQLEVWLKKSLPNLYADWPLTKEKKDAAGQPKPRNRTFARPAISIYRNIPAIAALLDYKKVAKLLNTYGNNLRELIHPYSGRLHASYSLGETRTGRLSSSGPNQQNYPREQEFRSMFIAPSGCKMVVYDLNQIEIRVAAELSRDKTMLRAFENKIDLHKLIVSQMTGKNIEYIDEKERRLGKNLNFGLQFGMGNKTLRRNLAYSIEYIMDEDTAQNAIDTYKNLYAGYDAWGQRQRLDCDAKGYVTTPLGKRRKLVESEVYTKSLNCPIQGGAAEVLMCVMVILFHSIRKLGLSKLIKIAATVHDEVILFAADGHETVASDLLKSAMAKGMRHVFPTASVDGICNGGAGNNWATAK